MSKYHSPEGFRWASFAVERATGLVATLKRLAEQDDCEEAWARWESSLFDLGKTDAFFFVGALEHVLNAAGSGAGDIICAEDLAEPNGHSFVIEMVERLEREFLKAAHPDGENNDIASTDIKENWPASRSIIRDFPDVDYVRLSARIRRERSCVLIVLSRKNPQLKKAVERIAGYVSAVKPDEEETSVLAERAAGGGGTKQRKASGTQETTIRWSRYTTRKELRTQLRLSQNAMKERLVLGEAQVEGKIRYRASSPKARKIQVAVDDLQADKQATFCRST